MSPAGATLEHMVPKGSSLERGGPAWYPLPTGTKCCCGSEPARGGPGGTLWGGSWDPVSCQVWLVLGWFCWDVSGLCRGDLQQTHPLRVERARLAWCWGAQPGVVTAQAWGPPSPILGLGGSLASSPDPQEGNISGGCCNLGVLGRQSTGVGTPSCFPHPSPPPRAPQPWQLRPPCPVGVLLLC